MMLDIGLVIAAYLLGALPVIYCIGRAKGLDLRLEYDMHLALWRKVGYRPGLAAILWDMSKGVVPPLAARCLDLDMLIVALSGLAVVVGQMWPVPLWPNKGEKGNSTGLTASFVISPPALGIALIPIAIGAFMRLVSSLRQSGKTAGERFKFSGVSNSVPLGMAAGFATTPLAAWGLGEPAAVVWTLAGLFALIMLRRVTADLKKDLESDSRPDVMLVVLNRFFYDRSQSD